MTMKQIENKYGLITVTMVSAMMGAGWSTDDTQEEIAAAHGITNGEASVIHEIMQEIEEVK